MALTNLRQCRSAVRTLLHGASNNTTRARLAAYFIQNISARLLPNASPKARKMRLALSGLDVVVAAYASQLGSYHDIWLENEYGEHPEFVARAGATVVDVGGNVGFYSLWQLRNMQGQGIIQVFEPSGYARELLSRNLSVNFPLAKIEISHAAVWRNEGRLLFSSEQRATSTGGVVALEAADGSSADEVTEVPAVTLDGWYGRTPWLDRIDVLKLDVEGAEYEVLQGAVEKVLPNTNAVVLELHGETEAAVVPLLRMMSFERLASAKSHVAYFRRQDGRK